MSRSAAPTPKLLVIDDDPQVLAFVAQFAESRGFNVIRREGHRDVLDELRPLRPDAVVVDLRMPELTGIDVLKAVRASAPACHVILMSGSASIDSAVEAVKLGALDYLTKPLDLERLGNQLAHVRFEFERRRRLLAADTELASQLNFYGMVGRGPEMQELFSRIRRLAPHIRTALITGETGTGKELVARALHRLSSDAARRLISCNCAAIPEALFESEFFGHARGAFTGALESKPGLFEHADRGTLFLDEVGELPLTLQPKLLRVLECGEIRRVGTAEDRQVSVRTVAATNRDLSLEVRQGRFRADLFYRLNLVEFHLPALRDRREDISYLTASFINEFGERFGRQFEGLTSGAERLLHDCNWPGNVRELRHTLERACMLSEGLLLTEDDINAALRQDGRDRPAEDAATKATRQAAAVSADDIREALSKAGGNRSEAARLLGLGRRSLYRRLTQLDTAADQ